MGDYWFKPKSHGYGATPTTWQGLAVTLAFVFAALIASRFMLLAPLASGQVLGLTRWAEWVGVMAVLLGLLIAIARAKTSAPWKWRWGEDE